MNTSISYKLHNILKLSICILLIFISGPALASDRQSKIKGTGGVSSISGAGGGGITPWATLSSYASEGQRGAAVFVSRANVDDFELDVAGAAVNLNDRFELSYARQNFTIKAADAVIRQDKLGLRYRLAGDVIYGSMPQVTLGLEHGNLKDPAIARAVGARHTQGTDFTASAGRAWLDGIAHRTTLLNVNLRYGNANQFGILGYSGDDPGSRWQAEIAGAVFLTRSIALGFEYRQKPDNLSALREQSAKDVFIAFFPNKRVSLTAAWVDLGEIAGAPDQRGVYLSLQATL